MSTVLTVLLIIVSVLLITVIILQPGKSAGLSGAISGGAEQLFGKQKARGLELILHRTTIVLSVVFFAILIALAYFVQ
ncbi:preprotein translocase subunit SecG [Listeria monocytogenes]|mgnify:CR=1 FL=1|jgi:protein translocase, SecG subunit|uniref:Protein-export membrane protein SecG n=13 Tax=Bacteria TaxID=2 RepID=Q8Y4I8_LISMO|nr:MULTISPECIES: preprotein translocase subunit SecG [Listeria]NP_465974.1 preprotein translocase subunit SecG [Listeria monocytogenes EGD-e]EAA0166458.1 preprotein translocase subunit SecG [Listeria monocytogenes serotype 1/2a]EAD3235762.1 preprotein translocase subunit SecG [Listeria monocytogenes CFSAN002202]EAE1680935.1 preprotein translocase subunit SecG [Listeria monocytogenes LIS0071]EAE3703438.1 preprotein translocase subunit SecG [Listeria monocytogenes serotype 1/2c]EAE3706802.1 pre